MKRIFVPAVSFFVFLLGLNVGYSQDFTFSQFATMAHVFNPACAGRAETDARVVAAYRNQWFSSGYPYQTYLVSGEAKLKLLPRQLKQSAIALSLADDQIGNGQWRNTWFSLGISATKELDAVHRHRVSLGISGALLMRRFNAQNLTFENQFESSSFDFNPAISSGENLEGQRQSFFQLNSGLQYDFIVSEKLKLSAGGSALWLYRPSEALSNLTADRFAKMHARFTGQFTARLKLSQDLAAEPQFFYSEQGKARELNLGGWLVFSSHWGTGGLWETGIGCFSRMGDAVIPAVRLGNGRAYGQLSYDATFSGAKGANAQKKFIGMGGMGSLELSLVYGFDIHPKPFRSFPAPCQTF